MPMTEVGTEKVTGRITNVKIGYDSSHGVNIIKGILRFEYARIHNAQPKFVANSKTSADMFQPHSNFTWKLRFLSDCKIAFFATDVQAAAGSQYALVNNGDSNKIEYFRVLVAIEDADGLPKTRTYTITNGYCLQNSAYIGDDEDGVYEYDGIAEYISYSDAP